ncbi:NAD(P)H-hydrate dehydratase [Tsukamurella tyrosinosolvens]|uniref:NAD(P)H-hydrate dehydratase n=1 Tax=Tsukamurella tyrosinosolvens TaxID=57704 RepID=UPI00079162C6|nr:NAD(P)H-hydrate dehydratase [Tsukamurella tyrosinosolvens]KXP07169.1 bifunctional ADP-dependent (S)-NAD(P)H-hydrate dehydratase/NAD(P)H-hydrate epimerase [Tsukamurella tyrosinosolvens]KZL98370.1 bifunctional ADP-dependent (S)-NAD(P)H-hydrate dehydratase/NAD(P)H-hydrate epimerase [Tsukamurella tyrosinosolvens]MCA4994550.1 NAD(P)H-hydrate dehydratase [Tsukamurella tyrosinosolvens]WEL92555.1 NAD(P)H-hydrate dehydratase [Tsukamurella tyrosinosolvens]
MRHYHHPDSVRAAEAPLLAVLPDGALMRRAAHGLAGVCAAELAARTGGTAGRRVTLLVGSGDNGGDALFAGAFLRRRGVAVEAVLLAPDRAHAAGLRALRRAGGRIVGAPRRPDLVVDGIVGISARGALRPEAADLVAGITAPIVAADTPSGVDVRTGVVHGPAVSAAVTVAFGALKPVHALAPARCGRIELIDIGLAFPSDRSTGELLAYDDADLAALWPVPGPADDKYSLGVLGVVAGGATYPGAAVLATGAAIRATSGMVRYAGTARDAVLAAWPEAVASDDVAGAGRVQAWAAGPGMGVDGAAADHLARVLDQDLPTVLDADALTLLAEHPGLLAGRSAPTVLTPHAGEFARLVGPVGNDRVAAVREAARELDATVLLKGHVTVIAAPDGTVVADTAGSSWAATPGSGDVLTGLVGKLLASGLAPLAAAACAARVHGLAAARAADGAPTHAAAISAAVPGVLRVVLRD